MQINNIQKRNNMENTTITIEKLIEKIKLAKAKRSQQTDSKLIS